MNQENSFEIGGEGMAKRILVTVLVIQVGLMVGDLVFNFLDVFNHVSIRRIFNVAREESLPTWFSSLQALLVATTSWALWRFERSRGWLLIAIFFLYVSIDDAAAVHERVATAISETFPTLPFLADYPSFSWHLLVAPILAAGLLAVAFFLWFRLPTGRTRVLVSIGLVCFAVSQFIDVLEGVDGLFDGWATDLGVNDYTVGHGLRGLEEWLEMIGTAALWAPMLFHLFGSTHATVSRTLPLTENRTASH